MLFRQLFDKDTSTYTYLLADRETHEALLIDPVREQVERDLTVLEELGLTLKYVLETHVHADHVTGAGLLSQKTGAKIAYSKLSGVGSDTMLANTVPSNNVVLLDDEQGISVGKVTLEARLTPGHTDGDVTFVTADRKMAFTGDSLLIRGCGRTDFQQGDARTLFRSVKDKILSLPADTLLYPGHDYKGRTVTTVCEEKSHNPRLKDSVTEDEFVVIMDGLGLAPPKRIDIAVPANLNFGLLAEERGEDGTVETLAPSPWALVSRTPTGVPEVTPEWVATHAADMLVVDVRESAELAMDGYIEGSTHVPLAHLREQASAWERDQPVVVLCRSGGRSGRGALELEQLGFRQVASMNGGLGRWLAEQRPVSRAAA
jgi:glyoxylase-like metal-dependent hydrolase (beta-lactamase superfamily II)/rhodanese-related sulfurtransferase